MGYFEKHPVLFRVLLLTLALYFIGIGAVNTYYITSSSTDENLFTTPPSNLYIVRGFPAERDGSSSLQIAPQQLPDSVRAGNMLTSVNGIVVHNTSEVQALLEADSNTYIMLGVFSLKENKGRKYKVRRSSIPGYFVRDIPTTAYVIEVTPGGASDQAGIRVGDLIVSINGRRFEGIFEADKIMRQGRAGISINYEILRNNTTLNLNLTLSRVRFPLTLLMVFLCGMFYMGTGLFIGLRRPKLAAARLLSLALLGIGFLWIGASYGGASVPTAITLMRFLTIIIVSLFSLALWFHASLYFPVEQPHLQQKKWLYRIPYYVAAGCSILMIALGLLNSYGDLLLLASFVFMILYTTSMLILYRKQFTPEYKRISKPLRRTAIFVPLAIIVLFFVLEIVPESRTVWTAILAPSFMTAIPLSYLYVIGRYRLLNLNLRVRRTIQYTFLSSVWKMSLLIIALSTLYLLTQLNLDIPNIRFTGVAVEIPKEPISEAERAVLEKITLMIAAICFMFAFWEIGRAGQNYINRVYYRSDYDYRQASVDFADIFSTKFNLEELAAGIVQQTARSVHLRQAGILIFRDGKIVCRQDTFNGDQQPEEKTAIDGAALHRALLQFHGGFSVNYLPRIIRDTVHSNGYYHLIPIRSKENTIGVIAIGEKLSEADVEREDLAFLESVSRQAAVAIENAFLYKEIAEQERLKHELAIAREIQLASLPQITPDVPGLDIAGMSCPALEVGGDYFDYLNGTPGSITVLVGDVSGKGTSAALYMSKVQGILRSLHAFNLSPKELFVRTNQLLFNDLEKRSYVTALSARFTPTERSINIARAGHLPLLHFDAGSNSINRILPMGLGLGMVNSNVFSTRIDERILSYNPGDIFLFVTDGVTEAMNEERSEFGDDRLQDLLRDSASASANTIRDVIHDAVREFTGSVALHDDFTVVVVKAV